MKNIHLIEKSASYNRVPSTSDEWKTGTWSMSSETAKSLVGGKVFLHTAQNAPCYLGGEIMACESNGGNRYTIHFRFEQDTLNVTTEYCEKNWAVEMLLEKVA